MRPLDDGLPTARARSLSTPPPADRNETAEAIEHRDVERLERLARVAPESFAGLHDRLIEAGLFTPALMFENASASARDRLFQVVRALDGHAPPRRSPEATVLEGALSALAWIGDDEVQRAFVTWEAQPPSWAASLPQSPLGYAREAGWVLRPDATRRDLFLEAGRALKRADAPAGPVLALAPHSGECEHCAAPLDSLFRLDLTAPELDFLPMEGRTLSIPFCHHCSVSGPISFRVDGEGNATWHEANPPISSPRNAGERWKAGALVLGEALSNPFERLGWLADDVGHVGGYPGWIHGPAYPECLDCREESSFIGQLQVTSGGRFYGFLCSACGVATTVYQGT